MSIMPDTLSLTAGAASSWLRRSPRSLDLNPGIPVPSSQFPVPSWRCESSPLLSAAKTRLKRKHSTFHCRSASSRVDLICKLRPLYRLSWDWDWEWDWDLDWDWDSWVRFSDTIHDRKLAMPMPPIEQAPCVIQSA